MNITEILEKAYHCHLIDDNWNYNKVTKILTFEEYTYCFYVDNNENVIAIGIYFKDKPVTELIYKNDNNDEEMWMTHAFSPEVRAVLTNYWYAKHGFYFEDGRVYGS